MDTLHSMMRTLRPESKAGTQHLNVFREFLKHLDSIQRKAPSKPARKPASKPARAKASPRRNSAKRAR